MEMHCQRPRLRRHQVQLRECAKFIWGPGRVYRQGADTFFEEKKGGKNFFSEKNRGAGRFFILKKGGHVDFFALFCFFFAFFFEKTGGAGTFFCCGKGGQGLFLKKKKGGR